MSLKRNFAEAEFPFINITNLVDVALTMVVVLLMIAPFIEQGLDVKLPTSAPATLSVEQTLIVTVAPGQVYFLGSEKVTLDQLYKGLKQKRAENPKTAVVLKGDENIPYKDLIKVLDTIKKCDITMVGLATQAE